MCTGLVICSDHVYWIVLDLLRSSVLDCTGSAQIMFTGLYWICSDHVYWIVLDLLRSCVLD
ncbi:hypothetical protein DPMN_161635 [Dreissena polymorpha]|uniref:Uncharacterized protein n=1 Tax=Dreissena polymorpha TaxID=45954 RepID=A0A9D4ETI2_DREPO|nr:hypothetical protein DPMN_161635 [Dreissena polymorpha]